jgi:hypothetical protein
MKARALLLTLLLVAPASSLLAGGTAGWSSLKEGMGAAQAMAALGAPLLQNGARGYQRWVYDSAGEVLLYDGQVIAWTQPVANPESEARPIERDMPLASSHRTPRRGLTKQPVNRGAPVNQFFWRS